MNRIASALALGALLLVCCWACSDPAKKITHDQNLGGQTIPADLLEEGRIAYMHYCRACHGDNGDGKGPAAAGLNPSPRDFTKGAFKFLSVENGQLPTDEDLKRIVKHGLAGTAMLPWDLSERELNAVVQYIKTFRPECPPDKPKEKCLSRWERAKKISEKLPLPPDPYAADEAGRVAAIEQGKKLYHTRGCNTCHPNYVTAKEYYDLTEGIPDLPRELRPEPYLPIVKEAPPFGFILPPDFTARTLRSGEKVEDIFRTITAGVGPMPTWKNVPEKDRWALAHYVKTLVDVRQQDKTLAYWNVVETAPPFTPPPPETMPASQPATMPGQPGLPGQQPAPSPTPQPVTPPVPKPPKPKPSPTPEPTPSPEASPTPEPAPPPEPAPQ